MPMFLHWENVWMKDVFHVDIILCKDGMLIHNLFNLALIKILDWRLQGNVISYELEVCYCFYQVLYAAVANKLAA